MLTQLLVLTVLTSFAILGFHYATLYDQDIGTPYQKLGSDFNFYKGAINKEVLWWIRYYFLWLCVRIKFLRRLYKPLFGCVICMSSVYGSASYWIWFLLSNYHVSIKTIIAWVVLVVAVAGLNRFIKAIAPDL